MSPKSRAVAIATLAIVACSLPVYLVGALGPFLRSEFGLEAAQLGFAAALFRGTGVVLSPPLGWFADRFGSASSVRLAASVALISSVAVMAIGHWWLAVLVCLAVAAAGKTLSQPAANALIATGVPRQRQGIAFGVKQSAAPIAAAFAGVVAPAIAVTWSWRWAFLLVVGAAILCLVLAAGSWGQSSPQARSRQAGPSREVRGYVPWFAAAFGFASLGNSGIPVFLVDAGVQIGLAPALAGLALTVASIAAIGARVGLGILADRLQSGHLLVCSGALTVGTAGLILMSLNTPWALIVGAILGLAGSWGFNGIFWYSVVSVGRRTPGAITGLVTPAGMAGGVVGPLVIGYLADRGGYGLGWLAAAACTGIAAVALMAPKLRNATSADE